MARKTSVLTCFLALNVCLFVKLSEIFQLIFFSATEAEIYQNILQNCVNFVECFSLKGTLSFFERIKCFLLIFL